MSRIVPGIMIGLVAAAACQAGEVDGTGGEEPLTLTMALDDEAGAAAVGSYADGVVTLDQQVIDTFSSVTVAGETMSLPTEFFLAIGEAERAIPGGERSVAVAEPLSPGDALSLRVVRDGEQLADIDLEVADPAEDVLYSTSCWPVSQWSRTTTGECGSCQYGKRQQWTDWGWNIYCSDGRQFQVLSGWYGSCLNWC